MLTLAGKRIAGGSPEGPDVSKRFNQEAKPAMNDPTRDGGNQLPNDPIARARAAAAAIRSDTPPAPAHDPGLILADLPRADGTRLRVAWREYEGHPFVTFAVCAADGWPVKGKQLTVKRAEIGAVLEALIIAAEKASGWRK
jgi:hypothetical protein